MSPSFCSESPGWLVRACAAALLAGVCATTACHRDPKVTKARYVESGERYLSEGKLAEAVLEFRNALQTDALDGEVRLKLADAYAKSGQGRPAVQEYIRAADVLVDRPDVQLKAGALLLMGGRFDDAKVRAEKALAVAPKDVQAQILLANALAGLKDLKGAVAEIEEAIKLQPDRSASYTNLGVIELGRGKREAAEKAFKKAIELDERAAQAHLSLANFLWATGRQPEAATHLAKALAAEPDNTLVLRAMANFAMAQNRMDEAERFLKRIVDITKSAEATVALADFYIARKDEATARNVLTTLGTLEGSPQASAAAAIRLAALDHADGRRDEAVARLDKILASDATNLQALLVKSTLLLSDRKRDEALVPAEQATKAHSESAAAFFTLGRVQTARNQTEAAIAAYQEALRLNPRATGAQVALARLHLAKGNAAESVGFAQDAVKSDPRNPEARLTLVRGLIARGDLDRAAPEITRLSTEYPNVAAVRVQRGVLFGRQRDLTRARAEFDAALKLDANSVEALGGLVALDLAAKQPTAALARVKDRSAAPDASSALLMLAARTNAAAGDSQSAEQLLRRVLEKDASYMPAYSALGQLYLQQRRLDAALKEFEALAARDPKPVAPLTLIGMILQAQGKTAEARAKYESVMAIDSSAPVAANNLAWMLAESGGNLDLALQFAQTAQRKLPESPEVNDTLGFVYYKKDLAALAVPLFSSSIAEAPLNPTYHLHLGLAYAKQGHAANARQSLERALELKPDFDGAQEARSTLQSLKAS